MSEYLVIYERGTGSWGAYVPDLPGLGVAAESREEAERLIREAMEQHIVVLRAQGEPVPEPSVSAGYIQVAS